jgi:hypothetical protein
MTSSALLYTFSCHVNVRTCLAHAWRLSTAGCDAAELAVLAETAAVDGRGRVALRRVSVTRSLKLGMSSCVA